jgi:hypothetical protein
MIGRAVVVPGYPSNRPVVQFAKLEGGDFVSRCGALLLFALLIESTVEVFLTILCPEEANTRHAFRKFIEASSAKLAVR